MSKPRLQIVRGLPGSGKSTYARTRWPHLLQYEFDFYCMRGGQYAFGDIRNTEGQVWLSDVVSKTLDIGMDLVVCGVFCGNGESLGGLITEALSKGYEVWLETLNTSFGDVHGVREKDRLNMRATFVPDSSLRSAWEGRIHFGSMPEGFDVVPLPDGL